MLLLVPTEDEKIVDEAKDIRNSLKNFMHETLKRVGCTRDSHGETSKCKVANGVMIRGGVEDTRLEAKDIIARGQGHKRKCSPKNKRSSQNFSNDLHKKTFSKKFFKRSTKF